MSEDYLSEFDNNSSYGVDSNTMKYNRNASNALMPKN